MIDDTNAVLRVEHQVRGVIIAMAKHARASRQFRGDVIQFCFELSRLAVRQCFFPIAAKVMLKKEIQFPAKLRFIKSEPAGYGIALAGFRRGGLNASNNVDRLLEQTLTFFV